MPRYYIDHSAHGIAAVEQRGRAPEHLDTVGQHGLVGVGDGVAHQSGVLRNAVYEHEHRRPAAHSAHLYAPGRTCRHAVAKHPARCHKQSGHLLVDSRQQRCAVVLGQFLPPHHRDSHRQVPDVGGPARPGHHYLAEPDTVCRLCCYAGSTCLQACGSQQCRHKYVLLHPFKVCMVIFQFVSRCKITHKSAQTVSRFTDKSTTITLICGVFSRHIATPGQRPANPKRAKEPRRQYHTEPPNRPQGIRLNSFTPLTP